VNVNVVVLHANGGRNFGDAAVPGILFAGRHSGGERMERDDELPQTDCPYRLSGWTVFRFAMSPSATVFPIAVGPPAGIRMPHAIAVPVPASAFAFATLPEQVAVNSGLRTRFWPQLPGETHYKTTCTCVTC